MKHRVVIAGAFLLASLAIFGYFLQMQPQDEYTRDLVFAAFAICFSIGIVLIFSGSFNSLKKREVMIDGAVHKVYVWSPKEKPEYICKRTRNMRLRVFKEEGVLKVVEERITGSPEVLWWENIGDARAANQLEARIYDQLFTPA